MSREYEATTTKTTIAPTAQAASGGRGSDVAPSPTASNGATAQTKPPRTAPRPAAGGAQAGAGRHPDGRFTKGNTLGRGNPFARQTAALRRELINTVTDDDIRQIAKRLVQQAKTGDVAAAKLLLSYTIGTPMPAPDPDTLDQHEWQVLRQQADSLETLRFMKSVPVETACVMARLAKPALTEQFINTVDDSYFGRYWPKTPSVSAAAAAAQSAPSTIGADGESANTPRDQADRRKQLKKKYVLKGGKLCRRDD